MSGRRRLNPDRPLALGITSITIVILAAMPLQWFKGRKGVIEA